MEEMFFCPNCMAKAAPVDGKCPVCGCDVNIQNALHQLPVNTILNGRYIVGKVLGAGGFGITYIGYDLKLDGKVAIKEYYPSGAANRSMSLTVLPTTEVKGNPFEIGKDRFLKEAKTLSEFVGEGNIVTLRDYFEENGTAYIVMEYLEGEDLSHYAKEHGKFELDEALELLEPAMLALDKIHKKGLIHRDISPSNIMVLSDGRVKVLDFGSARLQNASGELSLSIMLKPGYAPAEQYSTHGEQGSWTDVYAMSATIYKLITGKTPPPSTDRILDDTIELPSSLGVKITPEQEAALMRGLALRVPDRTQTMAELAKSLRGKKKASPPKPAKPPKPPKPPKPTKPAVDLKKKTAPAKSAEENKKPGKPALSKKRLLIIAAAVLGILAVAYITVPKAIDMANHRRLVTAREAIAGHSETTISASYNFIAAVKTTGTVITGAFDYMSSTKYDQVDIGEWTDITAVSTGLYYTVGLKANGTVVAAGDNGSGQCNIGVWKDIVAISAGVDHTVGLKADGTVVAVGNNRSGQCDVGDWTDIVAVSAGSGHTVGLKADGTVTALGSNYYGQCDVSDWTDIVAVSAGMYHTVGLKLDGTVVAVGSNSDNKCSVSDWTDIVAVSASDNYTMGLKADGTVVAVGSNGYGPWNVRGWTDIVAISAGSNNAVGLKKDGTVVSILRSYHMTDIMLPGSGSTEPTTAEQEEHLAELAAAREAITGCRETTISAGELYTIGLRSDGTVAAAGRNLYGQCDVSDWTDIVAVSAGPGHSVGLRSDGTVVAAGYNSYGQCDVTGWTDIIEVRAGGSHTVGLRSDGTVVATGNNASGQCEVDSWTDIVSVSAGENHTIGLKADGTVVAAGSNKFGQCGVSDWDDIIAVSTGANHTVGLKIDGTIVCVGYSYISNPSDWENIAAVSAWHHTAGLKADGTVVLNGSAGSKIDVSDWTDIVAVSLGSNHMIGLKADGTVVAAGENDSGQCDVSGWTGIKLP